MIQAMLADDEAGMRLLLRKAVEKHGGIEIIAEAENGASLVKTFEELRPRAVFLDVEMPELSGIEAARRILETAPETMLVFVTAHEAYRPEAFEVYAMDYLVKPFDIERLNETLDRIVKWSATRDEAVSLPSPTPSKKLEKIMIKGRDEAVLLSLDDIIMIKREDRQSVICTRDGGEIPTRDTLGELESRLPEERFFRSHKSFIVNLDYISHIYPYGRWTYITRLRGTKLDALITREKYEQLEGMSV